MTSPNKHYPAVLVLGVVPSLTWPVARCLKRAGCSPTVLSWHALSPMKFTADCSGYIPWVNLRKTAGRLGCAALEQVRAICRKNAIEAVLAADYDTALLLAELRDEPDIPKAAVPHAEMIIELNNKWTFTRLLGRLGLPHPESEYAASAEDLLATKLEFPIITKPLDLWASVGFEIHHSHAELANKIATGKLKSSYPLIVQRYVPGWDSGASFLAKEGRLVAYSTFQHKKDGERIFFDDDRMRGYIEKFVAATDYSGVGHIDTRYDPALDEYRILELNPRFWASLLYAANAGLNYPDLLVRLEEWDGRTVSKATPRRVALPPYERAMTMATRYFGIGYEKLTGAVL